MAGKGLESLIPRKNNDGSIGRKEDSVQKDFIFWIDINKIHANPYQPRKEFNEDALNSLAESIKKYGVLQPIIVTRLEKKTEMGVVTEYQIIAGERRFRASKIVGLKQIPVIIKERNDQEKLEIALIENVQRKNLNPIDKAEALNQLKEEFGLIDKEIAQIAGLSRESVSNSLRILSLPEKIIQALREERITEGHARALLSIKEVDIQEKVFEEILANSYSVRDVEKISRGEKPKGKKSSRILAGHFENKDNFEKKVKSLFNYEKLKVNNKRGKIQLVVDFDSENDFKNWIKNFK
ncbi:MAG: ParB/RepB/Spo0J family partition protein [Candidatus Paceibacterota bacterium]|jgi:ParB family chromosome partitioning protein